MGISASPPRPRPHRVSLTAVVSIVALLTALVLVGLIAASVFRDQRAPTAHPPADVLPTLGDTPVPLKRLRSALAEQGVEMAPSSELDSPRFDALRGSIAAAWTIPGDDRLLLVVARIPADAFPAQLEESMPAGRDESQASGRLYVELDSSLPAATQQAVRSAVTAALT